MAAIGSSPAAWQLQLEEFDRRFYRKLNDLKIGFGMSPIMHSCDPIMNQVYERTIFLKIHKEFYAISCEILYAVFSRYGIIDGVERLSDGFHSTICFRNKESTLWAFEFLNGMNLYDDCCRLELFLAKEPKEHSTSSDSTSKDESVGFQDLVNPSTTYSDELTVGIEVQTSTDSVELRIQSEFSEKLATPEIDQFVDDSLKQNLEASRIDELSVEMASIEGVFSVEELSQGMDSIPQIDHPSHEIDDDPKGFQIQNESSLADEDPTEMEDSVQQNKEDSLELENCRKFSEVIVDSLCIVMPKVESEKPKGSCIANSLDNEVNLEGFADIRMISFGCFRTLSAHNLFVELPRRDVEVLNGLTNGMAILSTDKGLVSRSKGNRSYPLVFDPGGGFDVACDKLSGRISEYLGIVSEVVDGSCLNSDSLALDTASLGTEIKHNSTMPYDRGRIFANMAVKQGLVCTLVYDPGGVMISILIRLGETAREWMDSNRNTTVAAVLNRIRNPILYRDEFDGKRLQWDPGKVAGFLFWSVA